MSGIKKDFVEYFKNNNITFKGKDITEIFPEVLKPERKKIFLEVEFDNLEYDLGNIEAIMNEGYDGHWVFKELPEVFTREDVHKMFDSKFSNNDYVDSFIDKFLSERNKI